MSIELANCAARRAALRAGDSRGSRGNIVVRLTRTLRLIVRPSRRRIALLLATLVAPFVPSIARALPTGAEVAAGQVTVASPAANAMRIDQSTQKAIINWGSFIIGAAESVRFVQPNASAVALNRVLGGSMSEIYGSLSANGRIMLVNPSGVLFARGAQVDVGGIIASSLGIGNEDFLAARYAFTAGPNAGAVVNEGSIRTPGGATILIGTRVVNSGSIAAEGGSIGLAAGSRVTLDRFGDGLVSLSVDGAAVDAAINNSGTLAADGGRVDLIARAQDAALETVINTKGIIRADTLSDRNGVIVLDGGSSGVVAVSGTVQASGADAGETGGTVKVLGEYVGLFDGARIDASGDAGGGTVLVGGDYQGKNPEVRNALRTYVDSGASIAVDALGNGDGGKVIVWADDATRYFGTISARGGANGGDGGFVEMSGKQHLAFAGEADAGADLGQVGTVLLDPNDLFVGADPGGGQTQDATDPFQALDGNDYYVLASSLTGNSNYTLQAGNNVIFNANVDFGTAAGGALALNSTTMSLGAIDTGGGLLTINNSGAATQSDVIAGAGGLTKSGGGTLTLSRANTYTGATSIIGGTVIAPNAAALGAAAQGTTVVGGVLTIQNVTVGEGITVNAGGTLALTGNATVTPSVALNGALDYSSYANAVSFGLDGTATGLTGGWTGNPTVVSGSINSDTVSGSGATYNLVGADAGNNGTVSWTSIENLTDSAVGVFNMGTNGSVSGTITAVGGTLNYAAHGTPVTFGLGGTATGMGSWSGIATVVGSANTDTVSGSGATYNLTGADAGNGGGVSWTSFENLSDSGTGTFVGAGGSSISGALNAAAANLQGNLNVGSMNITGAVNLLADTSVTTSGGGITLGTVDGAQNLTLTTGAADVSFGGAVGGTAPLGALTINSARNVTANGSLRAASLTQIAGTGNTVLVGPVSTTGATSITTGGSISENGGITAGSVALNAGGNVNANGAIVSGGTTALAAGGQVVIAATGDIASAGTVTISGTGGGVQTAGDVTTSGGSVTYGSAVTLSGPVAINTTASSAGANVSFAGPVDGAQNLTLTAGAADVSFGGAVGGATPLGALTINSARNVTANGSVRAASLTQVAGTGNTVLVGPVSTTGATSITTGGSISENGGITAGSVALNAGGNVIASGAIVSGGSASVVAGGDAQVAALANGANAPISLVAGGQLTLPGNELATGSADLILTSGKSLTVTHNLSGATVRLTANGGDVVQTDPTTVSVSGGTVKLTASGSIGSCSSPANCLSTLNNAIAPLGSFRVLSQNVIANGGGEGVNLFEDSGVVGVRVVGTAGPLGTFRFEERIPGLIDVVIKGDPGVVIKSIDPTTGGITIVLVDNGPAVTRAFQAAANLQGQAISLVDEERRRAFSTDSLRDHVNEGGTVPLDALPVYPHEGGLAVSAPVCASEFLSSGGGCGVK